MHRLWLWPLVIGAILLFSWATVAYSLPKWLLIVPMILVGVGTKLDLKLAAKQSDESETVLANVSGDGDFGLNRGSQIAIGAFSVMFALMLLAWAETAPGNLWFNRIPGMFCVLVAGACLLPGNYRGYMGDLVAVAVLAFAGWFLVTKPWWDDGKSPLGFAVVFGGTSIAYLAKRYAHHFRGGDT